MTILVTESRFPDPDRAYRALIEAHRGLSDEASAALNSRLVLILANHIGDQAVLQEALALAKKSMVKPEKASS
jgi:predicted metal-dependent hydrolase